MVRNKATPLNLVLIDRGAVQLRVKLTQVIVERYLPALALSNCEKFVQAVTV
jgi:hypothetical protein